jgi:inner membrane protein
MIVLFLSTISHGLLDAMTTGGRGVGFFIPFENSRYFFPLRIIKVSPIGIEKFFSEWGVQVILSELKYIGIPCGLILLLLQVMDRRK